MAKPQRVSVSHIFAVTPHDSNNFSNIAYKLYVGGTGDISMVMEDGSSETLSSVPAGTIFDNMRIRRINSTGTTASNMVAFG